MKIEKELKQKFIIIIFGPTAVGKSAFAEKLAIDLQQAQIVNCDLGQFYKKLSIGTAKPDLKNCNIKHNLFDIIDETKDFNVSQYRQILFNKVKEIWAENEIPILVGGSGFYLKSLFFPPLLGDKSNIVCSKSDFDFVSENMTKELANLQDQDLWDFLYKIDPERAKNIDKNDIYRIKRALDLWIKTGRKPSDFNPVFDFPSNFLFIFLNKDRKILYEKINIRTDQMIKEGWIDEVRNLIGSETGTDWESFLKKKKIIGYDLIIDYLHKKSIDDLKKINNGKKVENKKDFELEFLIENIKKKTRNYAKRQITFWRLLEKQLKKEVEKNKYTNKVKTRIEEFIIGENEKIEIDLYIKELMVYLKPLFNL